MVNFSKRNMLQMAFALAAGSLLPARALARETIERPKFPDYPFKLGVASGDPLPHGFVIWTRLAPLPFDARAVTQKTVPVTWQISTDSKFLQIQQQGTVLAYAGNAHAVHVEVQGLQPERAYFYRFICAGETSPVGRAYTLPPIGKRLNDFRFAVACCQSFTDGYFAAYRDMVAHEPKLVIHTGDYVYEQDWIGGVRRIPVEEAHTLEGYRALYAQYKQDPALQAAHAACPWLMIWDDHEVDNDWGGDFSQDNMTAEQFLARKTAAFKAYFEHMPLRVSARPNAAHMKLYQRTYIGDLLQLDLLDCRQYRSLPACTDEDRTYRSFTALCSEAADEGRSMLGVEQERWLYRGLGALGARWNTLVQTTMLGSSNFLGLRGEAYDMDGWDGFAATRQRLLDRIKALDLSNPVSLGGNIHASYAGVVNERAFDPESEPLVAEIVATSISSGGGGDERYSSTQRLLDLNPHMTFFENRKRGYVLCDVSRDIWQNTLRVIADVRDPNSPASTLETLNIENGRPGFLAG